MRFIRSPCTCNHRVLARLWNPTPLGFRGKLRHIVNSGQSKRVNLRPAWRRYPAAERINVIPGVHQPLGIALSSAEYGGDDSKTLLTWGFRACNVIINSLNQPEMFKKSDHELSHRVLTAFRSRPSMGEGVAQGLYVSRRNWYSFTQHVRIPHPRKLQFLKLEFSSIAPICLQ